MADRPPVLLLTRPRESSGRFLRDLVASLGQEIESVISPVLEIVDHGPLPHLDPYETIVLSSAYAARRLGEAGLLADSRVCTVGETAAALSRQYGADAISLGQDADTFIAQSAALASPCIHCRGVHARGDIARRLSALGVQTDEVAVYDQVAVELTPDAHALLESNRAVVAPVFSPRSAELLSKQLGVVSDLLVVAISPATAEAWTGSKNVLIAHEPTAESMINVISDAF